MISVNVANSNQYDYISDEISGDEVSASQFPQFRDVDAE